jgi:hypothetical protein
MKIDLSEYPPGTKFKLKNEATITLIGKSAAIKDCYILEYDDGRIVTRFGNGEHRTYSDYNIESVIQDKYLVSYKDQSNTIRTIVVANPRSLTIDSFYESVKSVTSEYIQPYDILSWSKIEE